MSIFVDHSRALLVPLGTLLVAMLFFAEASARAADDRRLRVMAFNILEAGNNAAHVGFSNATFGGSRHRAIAQVIRERAADIVGVNECGNPAPLLKELGTNWHAVATGKSGYTAGIVSRLPMETLAVEEWLVAVRATPPGGTKIVVVDAHWTPPRKEGASMIQERLRAGTVPADLAKFETEVLAACDAGTGRRGYQHTLDVLRPYLHANDNVILTGDFNEPSHLDWTDRAAKTGLDRWVKNPTGRTLRFKIGWRGSKLLADAGLCDAYRTAFPDEVAKPGNTWTPPYPAGTPGRRPFDDQVLERIDMIYFSGPALKVVDAGVVGEGRQTSEHVHDGPWPSDHRALVATLAVTSNTRKASQSKTLSEVKDSAFCKSLEYVGIALQEPGWHIWGCSPIIGDDGKVHLFVERWPVKSEACPRGFDAAWRQDSEIAHYVGDKPEGPFKLRDIALKGTGTDTWDRYAPANPCIRKVDGKYVLLYIANPVGVTRGMSRHASTQRIGMAISDSLNGPWKKVGNDGKILDPSDDPKHWTHGSQVVNPAFLKRSDGKYLLYFKGKGANMGVAVADRLEGPYVHQPGRLSSNDQRVEDGSAFEMGGKVGFVTTDNSGKYGHGGGLLWRSADGISFSASPERGYWPPSHYLPKVERAQTRSYYGAGTFQRPQVLMQDGQPTYLYVASGTVINGGDGTVCYVLKCGKPGGASP